MTTQLSTTTAPAQAVPFDAKRSLFTMQQARGHAHRLGHELRGYYEPFGGGTVRLVRTCCDGAGGPALSDADLAAHARQLAEDLEQKLAAERLRWLTDGAPRVCVRPAGEAFGWRQGSGPCDCPPCLHRSTGSWVPRTDWGATV